MADVEIVIKLSEKNCEYIKRLGTLWIESEKGSSIVLKAILDGTLLPKGHGRLIILSEDAVKRKQKPLSFSCQNWISEVGLSNATVAIIEADKEE